MNRLLLVFFLLAVTCLQSCNSPTEKENTEQPKSSAQKGEVKAKLPNFQVVDLAGKALTMSQLPPNKTTIVFFFHPDCEHCQAEATELQKYTDKFTNTNFLMITWDEIPKIREFMQKYNLKAPITAYKIDNNTLAQTYGMIRLPAVYIYNTHQELVQQFSGEAKVDAILNYTK